MAGKALVNFADFVKATNIRMLTGPEEIHNDALKRTYGFFSDMLLGRSQEEVVRGGSRVKESVILTTGTQGQFYRPGETFQPRNEDGLKDLYFDWRFYKNSWGWVDQEVMLNEGESEKIQYKRIKKVKQQLCQGGTYEDIEAAWISAAPVSATMESQDGTDPYCLRAFITEAGGAPQTADGAPVAWTTVAGLNPSTESKWNNQVETYNYNTPQSSLLVAFRKMYRKVKFTKPKIKGGDPGFAETNFRKMRILTSADGQEMYEKILTEGNDAFRVANDAGSNSDGPMFRGRPVEYIEAMDDIGWTAGQPRFYWPNFEYIFPVFHQGRYFEEMDPQQLTAVGQPESWVVYSLLWYQMACRSRWRQGIVVPSASSTN